MLNTFYHCWHGTGECPPQGQGLQADFQGVPTFGIAPLDVTFTDLSVGEITSWGWDFGDGATSSLQNPQHTYQEAGSFTVQLTVTGPSGENTAIKQDYITVSAQGWETAYRRLFALPADLDMLRHYRDEVLSKTEAGASFTTRLYQQSEAALRVLLSDPALLQTARNLLTENKAAVAESLKGQPAFLNGIVDLLFFLDCFARRSPPSLQLLVQDVRAELIARLQAGEPFFGFNVKPAQALKFPSRR